MTRSKMALVVLNKKVFEQLVGKKLPLNELKDRISMLGTDLEKIEGDEIHVEIFPNRPDMLSEQGFARAFSSFIGVKTGLKEYKVNDSNYQLYTDKSLPKQWPYAFACVVKGLKFDDEKIREIIQIQEKLGMTLLRKRKKGGIGIYPLDKISFPIKFIGMDPDKIKFRPLEYPDTITGRQILSKHPTGREYCHVVDEWNKFPVFVDSKGTIMSMPPIINSHDVGKIDETTKDIFVEVTGKDPHTIQYAMKIIITSLADMGGKIYSIQHHTQDGKSFSFPDLGSTIMDIDIGYVNKLLGLDLKESDIKKCLERMGFDYKNKKVYVPAYRADILHQIDFVEDIAIAYGFENFKEEIPNVSTIGEPSPFSMFKNKVAEILVGLGLFEVNTYHLTNKDNQTKKMNCNIQIVELENALTTDYNVLQAWLVPTLLEVLANNKHNEYPQRIFDMKVVFKKNKATETGVEEFTKLCVLSCNKTVDYTEARQMLDYLLRMLGVEYAIKETEHASFIPGRVGRVVVKGREVAYIGEIHPAVLKNWDLKMPVAGFELNLTELFECL